jgi:hypothetical protein
MAILDVKRCCRALGGGVMATALALLGLLVPLADVRAAQKPGRTATPAKKGAAPIVLGYVGEASPDKRSLGGSGHAVAFQRPEGAKQLVGVQIYASRYGLPEPPQEDFQVYLLDQDQKVLKEFGVAYGKVERGPQRWYSFDLPPTDVPEKFFVALSFNPHQTKGVFLGLDKQVKESHSHIGLPSSGFKPVEERFDWMVRVCLSAGRKPRAK